MSCMDNSTPTNVAAFAGNACIVSSRQIDSLKQVREKRLTRNMAGPKPLNNADAPSALTVLTAQSMIPL